MSVKCNIICVKDYLFDEIVYQIILIIITITELGEGNSKTFTDDYIRNTKIKMIKNVVDDVISALLISS